MFPKSNIFLLSTILISKRSTSARSSPRKIISPPPQTKDRMHNWSHTTVYQRGSPSPLTRDMGNLHLQLRPLRRAVYQIYNATVKEILPLWDMNTQKVVWDESVVTPDGELSELLQEEPQAIIKHFFPCLERPEQFTVEQWYNHLWALHAVTLELLAQAYPEKYLLFDLMMDNFKPTKEILKGEIKGKKEENLRKPAVEVIITCVICAKEFEFLKSEKEFFVKMGYSNPKKCKSCRNKKFTGYFRIVTKLQFTVLLLSP